MAQHEIYFNRDGERAYSRFHRVNSASRFVPYDDAYRLASINIDRHLWIECHNRSKEPISLIETAIDINQHRKTCTAIVNLARRADVPAFLVLYQLGDSIDPVTNDWQIVRFRVKRLWPESTEFKVCTPKQYFEGLVKLRRWAVGRIIESARVGDSQKRNHDAPRLLRAIDKVSPQLEMDFWQ
jgi:hypothetical protein